MRDAPRAEITVRPTGTSYVPSNLRPSLAEAAGDQPVIYDNGCHHDRGVTAAKGCVVGSSVQAPRVVLFGDSHAAQWYPAFARLAARGRILLDSRTKSSCPSVETATTIPDTDTPYVACTEWRHRVTADLRADPPAVVVLANFDPSYNTDDPARGRTWRTAVTATLDEMPAASRVVLVADTPRPGTTRVPCLRRHRSDAAACDRPRAEMLDAVTRTADAQAVAGRDDVTYADFTDVLCNPTTCPTIIGDTLVYRDQHHLSATFSAELEPRWASVLTRAAAASG